MAGRGAFRFQVTALTTAFALLGGSGFASAQSTDTTDAVRAAVQAAVDRSNTETSSMNENEARSNYLAGMQAAITQSGAQPNVVQAALGHVSCGTAPRESACRTELANLLARVTQLAELEFRNSDVSAIRRALVAAIANGGAPSTAGGGGGGGTSYVTP